MFFEKVFPVNRKDTSWRRHGFTMIEVILSVTLLALTIIPVVTIINYGNKYKEESNIELIAFNLARDKLERFIKNPGELNNLTDETVKPLPTNGSVNLTGNFFGTGYEDYSCNITSQERAYNIDNGMVNVEVCKLETIAIRVYYRDPIHQKAPVVTIEGEVFRE